MTTNQVHVWLTEPAGVEDPALLRDYRALMDEAERRKHDRYRFERNRVACVWTRALVRTTLSRYSRSIEPAAWRFVETGHGRPELAPEQAHLGLRFNLSRTDGLIACAVALDRAVGVDVECVERPLDTDAVSERYFAASEVRRLLAQPADRRRERFYQYWTLKESYIKARGLGLTIPLNQFAFHLDGTRPRISFDTRLPDDPAHWQFVLERPTPRHVLALAVERRAGPDLDVVIRRVVPLRS